MTLDDADAVARRVQLICGGDPDDSAAYDDDIHEWFFRCAATCREPPHVALGRVVSDGRRRAPCNDRVGRAAPVKQTAHHSAKTGDAPRLCRRKQVPARERAWPADAFSPQRARTRCGA
jgi:hypothetical protein